MELSEEFADRQRAWKPATLSDYWRWETKSKDLQEAVQEGDQRFSDLQDEHKDALDRNRKLEAMVEQLEAELDVARTNFRVTCIHCARDMFLTDSGKKQMLLKDLEDGK